MSSISGSAATASCTRKVVCASPRALDVANLTNKVALYNFLSTFSGTHFLQPRTFLVRFGLVF
jgi:hypothetical protein